ncbi:MAG: ribosomal protein S18-alanine N-acetyltransferase [Caldilineaceae bacterium]
MIPNTALQSIDPQSLLLNLMTLDDLPIVDEIEQASFPSPWSLETFRYELQSNPRSFYWVLRPNPAVSAGNRPLILAYGGYWLMGEEAHVVILATHPQWRRQGLAEYLLIQMMEQMRAVDVHEVTLEVRAGNYAAQALYRKLGFEEVGRRKRYYRDNHEDALLLTRFGLQDDADPGSDMKG